jgi:predicted TIM-barrel fold metal-dependent hydrolase
MKIEDLVIISIDDHIVEPPHAFTAHYPAARKASAPRIIDRNGADAWYWNDHIFPTIALNAVVGRPRSEYGMEPTRFEQLRAGTYDPKARVGDMNVNGVCGSLNFPTFPRFAGNVFIDAATTVPEEALIAVRAYNDWHVLEWCATAPERFIPLVLLPLWDMTETLAEMKRMSALGVHAIAFPDNPSLAGLPSLHNPYWEPLWKACSDLSMVVNCHIGSGNMAPHASDESPIDAWITTMPISIANAAADWLFASFWGRYPDLRMSLSEGGIGWVPYLLERADHTYERQREWTFSNLAARPSEIFKKHIITCFIDEKFGLKNLGDMNSKMVCLEVDYPHSDTLWPNSPEYFWEAAKDLAPDVIDAITHGNVMREFSYDPIAAMGGRSNCNVGALRQLGRDVDLSPRSDLGGLQARNAGDGMDRRPVTSGEIQKMFTSA